MQGVLEKKLREMKKILISGGERLFAGQGLRPAWQNPLASRGRSRAGGAGEWARSLRGYPEIFSQGLASRPDSWYNKNNGKNPGKGGVFQMQKTNPNNRWQHILPVLRQKKLMMEEHCNMESVSMHDHEFLELTYILRGTAEHTLDGQTATLTAGDYLIVDYGSRHSYRNRDGRGYDNMDCHFLPELLDPVLKGTKSLRALLEHYLLHFNMRVLVQNPAHMVFHDTDGRILELLQRMKQETEGQQAGYTEFLRCYLVEILLLTMRRLDDAPAAATGEDICGFLIEYVRQHYMEPLTLQELARRLNYSLPYVSKRFKDGTGVPFMEYLQNYRVTEGCRLLSGTNRTLEEITRMVGYQDVKFFSALVKRQTGLSPRGFRRRYQHEQSEQ